MEGWSLATPKRFMLTAVDKLSFLKKNSHLYNRMELMKLLGCGSDTIIRLIDEHKLRVKTRKTPVSRRALDHEKIAQLYSTILTKKL